MFSAIASATVESLDGLRAAGVKVSRELIANAQILATIASFDETELKIVHEHLEQHKVALGLEGKRALLGTLNVHFGISLERSSKTVKELAGKVRFDDHRLCKAVCALFRDVREAGIDVVLYLDNLDELRHTYAAPEERERVRLDVDTVLLVREAPIGLVVNVRTYFSGILPREMVNRRVLRRMDDQEQVQILTLRLDGELDEVRARFGDAAFRAEAEKLARIAPTPLALLQWFKFLFEEDRIRARGDEAGPGRVS